MKRHLTNPSDLKIKIEKNIPVPESDRNVIYSPHIKKMSIGDSVYLEKEKVARGFSNAVFRAGKRGLIRREGSGWRVWFLEKKKK